MSGWSNQRVPSVEKWTQKKEIQTMLVNQDENTIKTIVAFMMFTLVVLYNCYYCLYWTILRASFNYSWDLILHCIFLLLRLPPPTHKREKNSNTKQNEKWNPHLFGTLPTRAGRWNFGLFGRTGCWPNGLLAKWNVGQMECWPNGLVAKWAVGQMDF